MSTEEKRNFKRYKYPSECELKVGKETYKGKMVNYSDGVCAFIENALQLVQGIQGNLRIDDLEMEMRAEVVFVKESDKGLKIGFKRIGNFKGNLKDFKLADILIGFQRNTRTGILKIEDDASVKRIFIKDGDIIFAASDKNGERIGELLLQEGKITLEEFIKSSYLSTKTGQGIEKYLVKLGYLTPEEASLAVQHQVEEILLSLFAIEKGNFEFNEGQFPEMAGMNLRISAANVVYKGIKRIKSLTHLKKICPPIDAVLIFSSDPQNIFQDFPLHDSDKEILSYVNGLYPLKTILMFSPGNDFETIKTICAFMGIGLIKVKGEDENPFEFPEGFFGEPAEKISSQFIQKTETMYNRCETTGYYDILGIEHTASAEEIKKAYYRVSREFHPDRHFSLPFREADLKRQLIKIFSCTTEAYETLSDPEKRKQYDKTLSVIAEEPEKEAVDESLIYEIRTKPEKIEKAGEEMYDEKGEQSALPAKNGTVAAGKKPDRAEEEIKEREASEDKITKQPIGVREEEMKEPEKQEESRMTEVKSGHGNSGAMKQPKRKRILLFISLIIIISVVFVVTSFLVFKNTKKTPQHPVPVVTKKKSYLPPFRHDLLDKLVKETSERE
jgi:hypothetical protein